MDDNQDMCEHKMFKIYHIVIVFILCLSIRGRGIKEMDLHRSCIGPLLQMCNINDGAAEINSMT